MKNEKYSHSFILKFCLILSNKISFRMQQISHTEGIFVKQDVS